MSKQGPGAPRSRAAIHMAEPLSSHTPPSPTRGLPPEAELLLRGTPAEILARIADGDPLALRARVAALLERRCLLLDPDRCLLLAIAEVARCACRWGGRPELRKWLGERVGAAVDQVLVEEARASGEWASGAERPGAGSSGAGSPGERAAGDRAAGAEPAGAEPLGDWSGTSGLAVREAAAGYGPEPLPALPPVDGERRAIAFPDSYGDWSAPASAGTGSLPVLSALARPLGLDADGLRRACAAFNARPEAERRAFDALVLGRDSLDAVAAATGSSGSAVGRRARRVLDAILSAVLSLPSGGLLPVPPPSSPAPPAE